MPDMFTQENKEYVAPALETFFLKPAANLLQGSGGAPSSLDVEIFPRPNP